MTVSTTSRLLLTRWSDDNDAWTRAQFTSIIDNIEALAATFQVGTIAAQPSATLPASARKFYFASDQRLMYFGTGTAWEALLTLTNTATQNAQGIITSVNNKVATKNEVGTAAPTTGTWVVGDKVWHSAPVAGGAGIGWVCTTAGTPGTWKTFGAISA
jgi:hypothetical protein